MNFNQLNRYIIEFNLFSRYKIDEKEITKIDIFLTYIYFLLMLFIIIGITVYKTSIYLDNRSFCEKNPKEQLCVNISLTNHIISLIAYIFPLKTFIETILIYSDYILNCIFNFRKDSNLEELNQEIIY